MRSLALLFTIAALILGCSNDPSGPAAPSIRAVPGSERQITQRGTSQGLVSARHADWSTDGSKLAFVGGIGVLDDIWTVRTDGTEMTEVIAFESFYPRWSPDGTQIACSVSEGMGPTYRSRFLTVPTTGGEPDTITPLVMVTIDADWSPDGTTMVVSAEDTSARGISDLWVIPIDEGAPVQITADSTDDFSPAWSPDGRWIVFASDQGGNGIDLYLIAADGTERQRLTTTGDVNEVWPEWSPDSQWLTFSSNESGNSDVWAMPVTGGAPVQLTNDPSYDSHPSWSPDGKQIAFTSLRGGGYDIWTIDVEIAD